LRHTYELDELDRLFWSGGRAVSNVRYPRMVRRLARSLAGVMGVFLGG